MNLRFERHGKQVRCKITVRVPEVGDQEFWWYWDCNSDIYAGLLTQALRNARAKDWQATHEEAYRQGWADAKAKRAKLW